MVHIGHRQMLFLPEKLTPQNMRTNLRGDWSWTLLVPT